MTRSVTSVSLDPEVLDAVPDDANFSEFVNAATRSYYLNGCDCPTTERHLNSIRSEIATLRETATQLVRIADALDTRVEELSAEETPFQ